jgi:hypothetical protein
LLMQSPISPSNELVTVWDPEVGRQNPSENKQLKLARSVTRVVIDRDLKPNINERKYWHFFLFYLCLHSVRLMHKQYIFYGALWDRPCVSNAELLLTSICMFWRSKYMINILK